MKKFFFAVILSLALTFVFVSKTMAQDESDYSNYSYSVDTGHIKIFSGASSGDGEQETLINKWLKDMEGKIMITDKAIRMGGHDNNWVIVVYHYIDVPKQDKVVPATKK